MLQELTAATGAQIWAIASMLFFLLAFLVAAAVAWRSSPAVLEACARLPLASDDETVDSTDSTPRAVGPNRV